MFVILVPRLRLGTGCVGGSASTAPLLRRSLTGIAFPGRAWERERPGLAAGRLRTQSPRRHDRLALAMGLPVAYDIHRSTHGLARAAPPARRNGLARDQPGRPPGANRQTYDGPQPAAFVRDTPAGKRLRYPHGPGTAGPCECRNDDDLHTRAESRRERRSQPAGFDLRRSGSAGQRRYFALALRASPTTAEWGRTASCSFKESCDTFRFQADRTCRYNQVARAVLSRADNHWFGLRYAGAGGLEHAS